jgi:hypothetical protein
VPATPTWAALGPTDNSNPAAKASTASSSAEASRLCPSAAANPAVTAAASAVSSIRATRSRYGPGRSANEVCSPPIAACTPPAGLPSATPSTSGTIRPTALRADTTGSDWLRSSLAASAYNRRSDPAISLAGDCDLPTGPP